MAPSKSQPPSESAKTRGAGGDIESKAFQVPDIEDAKSREESEGGTQAEASGVATANED